MVDDLGRVGIGTASPTAGLQVVGDEVRIGNGGTVDIATGDGDLYVEDALEVDGVSTFEGIGTFFSTLSVQGSSLTLGLSSTTDGTIIFENDTNAFTTTLDVTDATAARTITLPDASGTVLLDSTLATTAFIQNGNSFGATAVLGTNDAQSLAFETGGVTNITLADGRLGRVENSIAVKVNRSVARAARKSPASTCFCSLSQMRISDCT